MKNSEILELNKLEYIGKTYSARKGAKYTIVEYFGTKNITIEFEDGTIVRNKELADIKIGSVKNPNYPIILNKGFLGEGSFLPIDNRKRYDCWLGALARCYDANVLIKQPTYKGCTVHKDWHSFQNFAKWYDKNYVESWHLDKDILIPGNKVYGPDTCCFVPQEINKLFTKRKNDRGDFPIGVYRSSKSSFSVQCSIDSKQRRFGSYRTVEEAFGTYKLAKETEIKRIADKFRSQITFECYIAMYQYVVKITD